MEIDEEISRLGKRYKLFSREGAVICGVSGLVHQTKKSSIPNSYLLLAQDQVVIYQEKSEADKFLVGKLWEIVNSAWESYGEGEVAR